MTKEEKKQISMDITVMLNDKELIEKITSVGLIMAKANLDESMEVAFRIPINDYDFMLEVSLTGRQKKEGE